ncbi:MAG: hypothetical protein AAFZ17_17875 [Cyanobacteria bacterium J06650_10]
MRNTTRTVALERRFPNLCKVLYFPGDDPNKSPHAPTGQLNWYMRSAQLPRMGDVIPYGQYLFAVTAIILEDCCSAETAFKADKIAGRLAEKEESAKYQAVIWVEFWGVKST